MSDFRRSALALAILGLLENGPMHPYGIQRLIKRWGKDKVVNVDQRASLYRMIDRLLEAGLITAGDRPRRALPGADHLPPHRHGRAAPAVAGDHSPATSSMEFPRPCPS
jgi:hypothetical protein